MQSQNYVPGVSGWKMHNSGELEVAGSIRVKLSEKAAEKPRPSPFVVADGVVYVSDAFIVDASIKMADIESQLLVDPAKYAIKIEPGQDGRFFCAGVGAGLSFDGCFRPDIVVKAERIEMLPDGMVRIKQQQS